MKYLKLFLIPMIALMFFIPVNASDEAPPWVNSGPYYVVTEYKPGGWLTAYILSSSNDMVYYRTSSDKPMRYWVPETDVIETWTFQNGSWNKGASFSRATITGVSHISISYANSEDHAFRFSNFDVRIPGSLVFPQTPVINLAMVQAKALEGLTMEVQGASGTILAVGGLILGMILVVHLISRSRLWVKV